MVISRNSQLALIMEDEEVKIEFLRLQLGNLEKELSKIDTVLTTLKSMPPDDEAPDNITLSVEEEDLPLFDLKNLSNNKELHEKINLSIGTNNGNFVDNFNSKLYLICNGVEACSKMIKIGDNFSSKALRNVAFGKHTYLLGKNEMTRFLCAKGAIKGIYWNRDKKITFEYGFDLDGEGYYFNNKYSEEFNKIAKIITFVELGDIEVTVLAGGKNNHKPKKEGKITNTSNYTVYVVDSSWNKLIIRTDGFAVMGHFRLQACGEGLSDRKLIWINAFEKHGYKRRPKAEILK